MYLSSGFKVVGNEKATRTGWYISFHYQAFFSRVSFLCQLYVTRNQGNPDFSRRQENCAGIRFGGKPLQVCLELCCFGSPVSKQALWRQWDAPDCVRLSSVIP